MKLRTLWTVPSHVFMVGFAALFVSYADLWLEQARKVAMPVLAAYMLLIALVGLSLETLLGTAADARVRDRVLGLYRAQLPVLLPLAGLVALTFISAIRGTANMTEGARLVLYPAYWLVVALLSMLLPFPDNRRPAMRSYLLVGFGVAAASVMVDVAHPGTFSIQADRAAGFGLSPNTAGFLLVTLCCSIISYDRIRLLDVTVLVVTAVCVLATLSRGAALMLACVLVSYTGSVVRYALQRGARYLALGSAALVLLIGATYGATKLLFGQKIFGGDVTSNSTSRLRMLSGQEPLVRRDESRYVVAEKVFSLIRESPLVGYGSGFAYTVPIGPHNIYLRAWLDLGLLGILTYLWFLAAMALTFWRRHFRGGLVFTAVVTLQGFFSHNLFEERIFFVLLGVLLTCSLQQSTALATQTLPARTPVWRTPDRARRQLAGGVIHR